MSGRELIQQAIASPKVAGTVSATMTGAGTAGTYLEWIPNDIGKLVSLVGIILSIILIQVHFVSLKKFKLELKIMQDKEAERLARLEKGERDDWPG